MTTETLQHTDHAAEVHDGPHHPTDRYYWGVFAVLVVITAAEVALSYADVGKVFLPTLLILMTIKFVMVVSIFMHLKFDHKIFSVMFYAGLILAVAVYCAALSTAQFWTK